MCHSSRIHRIFIREAGFFVCFEIRAAFECWQLRLHHFELFAFSFDTVEIVLSLHCHFKKKLLELTEIDASLAVLAFNHAFDENAEGVFANKERDDVAFESIHVESVEPYFMGCDVGYFGLFILEQQIKVELESISVRLYLFLYFL